MLDVALVAQLFVLINPFSTFPFVMGARERGVNVRPILRNGVLTAFFIAVAIAFVGPSLFKLFGITLDSFRIAGGIVLLLLGIETLRSREKEPASAEGVDGFTAVLATPLLTGPATISFVTLKAHEMGRAPLLLNLCLAFALVAVTFFFFWLVIAKVNTRVMNIVSRVLGLFLTAVAIEMISGGLAGILGAARRI